MAINGFEVMEKIIAKERKEQYWNSIASGNHKCKVYFKIKSGRSLLDSNYMGAKVLTKKEVEFLNGRTTKKNILKKLHMVKNAEDVPLEEVNIFKLERRFFEDRELNERMLDDHIRFVTNYFENIKIARDINFKIIVKIAD